MSAEKQTALKQIDNLLAEHARAVETTKSPWGGLYVDSENFTRLTERMRATVFRLSPIGSHYPQVIANAVDEVDFLAILKALRDDYENDCLQSYRELLNADLYSDFLEMAEYLLQDENLKQPAAVLAGGVLEEHLRKLCGKHGIATTINGKPKKADTMNADLRKAGVYGANDQKQVTAWCGIRNSAAHAEYDEFDEPQVRNMIEGIRSFISRYPA